jgi:FtsH-binding integral membrane protein
MNLRKLSRQISFVLGCGLVLIYIVAKLDYFAHYDTNNTVSYLQEHSVYWLAMAIVAFVIWLIQTRFKDSER